MGRGVSSGGGQSSLGYLFGSDEAPAKPSSKAPSCTPAAPQAPDANPPPAAGVSRTAAQPAAKAEDTPDHGVVKLGRNNNNYHRADGQNTGNFITDRPSTKVHSAPGGGSSLGYLFGGN